jgi:hypothetical protein
MEFGPKGPILGQGTLFGIDPPRCLKSKQYHMENKRPTEDKYFYRYIRSEVILTKDNLVK